MISERIQEARKEKGVSMRQAAIDMGFPYTTYVNYEKGVSEPNSEALAKIAVYYQVSADYLVGTDEIKWFMEAAKFEESMNKQLEIDWALLKKLFPDADNEDIHPLLHLLYFLNHLLFLLKMKLQKI